MAASNLNVVVITGNLTRDPELRSLPSGTSVCDMRIAVNTRRKNGATGEWETQDGQKRQAVDIIAESVQFLGGRDDAAGGFSASVGSGSRSDVPVDERDFQTATSAVGIGDDDIPF